MGVMDKFKNLVGVVDDDEIENEYVEPSEADINRAAADLGNYEKSSRSSKGFGRDRKIVPMSGGNMKLVVIEPKAFEESPELVNSLKDRKPVIINLENIDQEIARKIFDFLSGATYALNGNIQKIANNIFVFAPDNVDITSDDNSRDFDFKSL